MAWRDRSRNVVSVSHDSSRDGSEAVVVQDLVVRYGDFTAVDGISFIARAGQVTAVLGPNGAGKTSTLEVCEGYRAAAAGSVSVLGLDPKRQQARLSRDMGVMLQEGGVLGGARVGDVVRQYCDLYGKGVSPTSLLDTVGLSSHGRSTYRRLSGGEKQRFSLALALAARPRVAFLDEPTSGVDVSGRQSIRTVVRELADSGCAVVLATHELDEAEKLADHVVIFHHGRVVANATLAALRSGHDFIRFSTTDSVNLIALSVVLGVAVLRTAPGVFEIASDASRVATLSGWLAEHGYPLANLQAGQQRLEDVVLRLTQDKS